MRSCARLEWEGFKRRPALSPPLDGKLLDLSCLLIHRNDHGVAVMSIVIELLVLLGKKMFIVQMTFYQKKQRKFQKRCTFHSSIIVFHNITCCSGNQMLQLLKLGIFVNDIVKLVFVSVFFSLLEHCTRQIVKKI